MPKTATALLFAGLLLASPATAHEVGAWAGASNAPAERSEVAVAAIDGKAYVVGDYNGATELLIYDLAKDSWSRGAAFPYAVHHTMAVGQGGKIYVFGGYVNGWDATDKVWAYDPKTDAWEPRAPLPTARAAGGATLLGDKIHVVSGSVSGRKNTPSTRSTTRRRTAGARPRHLRPRATISRSRRSTAGSSRLVDGSTAIPEPTSPRTRSTTRPRTPGPTPLRCRRHAAAPPRPCSARTST